MGAIPQLRQTSEIALSFLEFHGAFLVVIDHAVLALRPAEAGHFVNDLRYSVGVGKDGARTRHTPQGSHAAFDLLRALAWKKMNALLHQQNRIAALNSVPLF